MVRLSKAKLSRFKKLNARIKRKILDSRRKTSFRFGQDELDQMKQRIMEQIEITQLYSELESEEDAEFWQYEYVRQQRIVYDMIHVYNILFRRINWFFVESEFDELEDLLRQELNIRS